MDIFVESVHNIDGCPLRLVEKVITMSSGKTLIDDQCD